MVRWAAVFLGLGIIAGALGFGLIAGVAFEIAKFFFYIFAGMAALLLIAGWWTWKKLT